MSSEPSSHAIEAAAEIQRNVGSGNWGRGAIANRIQYALNAATAGYVASLVARDNQIAELEAQITELRQILDRIPHQVRWVGDPCHPECRACEWDRLKQEEAE